MRRRIKIIGAASGLGAQDEGCARGPLAIRHSPAWLALAQDPGIVWDETLAIAGREGSAAVARIAALCTGLAARVAETLAAGDFPLVIGGDHSVAIGTWSGVARFVGKPVGLLWIDAHLDSHTPQTSHSGAIHGMPLACLLGRGDPRLLALGLRGAQLDPQHTVVLGPRSWEAEESAFLAGLGVRVIGAKEIRERGLAACFSEALGIVAVAGNGFGITLDLDAFDPAVAPGVGSPEPGGLPLAGVRAGLRQVVANAGLRALEIVEYNPQRDRHGMTAQLICAVIGDVLSSWPHDRSQPAE